MDSFTVVCCGLFIIIIVILLYFILKKRLGLDKLINTDVGYLQPTRYFIFDKSTEESCNRFIRVDPFRWYLWVNENQLYVIATETGFECEPGSTSAISIFSDQNDLDVECINMTQSSILSIFEDVQPLIVPFDIGESYTVVDAINELSRMGYITTQEKKITQKLGKIKIVNSTHNLFHRVVTTNSQPTYQQMKFLNTHY